MSKKIPKNLLPFNNSGANEDDKEEGNGDGDGDGDDNTAGTYTLRTQTRRRRSFRRATDKSKPDYYQAHKHIK